MAQYNLVLLVLFDVDRKLVDALTDLQNSTSAGSAQKSRGLRVLYLRVESAVLTSLQVSRKLLLT